MRSQTAALWLAGPPGVRPLPAAAAATAVAGHGSWLAAGHSRASSSSSSSRLQQSLWPPRTLQQQRGGRGLAVDVQARDGKKRRKPQQPPGIGGGGSSSDEEGGPWRPSPPPPPPPRRVDPNINIPVRLQQRWGKINKEYDQALAGGGFKQKPPQAQAFRKDSQDTEEYKRQRQEQERIAEEAAKQKSGIVTLQGMFRTNISAPGEQPTGVVLVDGYNLLFRWKDVNPDIAKLMAAADANPDGGDLEAARQKLLRGLDVYSHQEGMFVHVVLDAMRRGFTSQHNVLGMQVTFTGRTEADTFIRHQAQEYIHLGVGKVCLVTDDVQLSELGSGGVTYKKPGRQVVCQSSCSALIKLMADSQRKMDEELAAQAASPRGTSLLTAAEQKQKSRAKGSGGGPHSLKAGLCGLRGKLVEQETQLAAEQRRRNAEEKRQQRLAAQQAAREAMQRQQQQQQKPPQEEPPAAPA